MRRIADQHHVVPVPWCRLQQDFQGPIVDAVGVGRPHGFADLAHQAAEALHGFVQPLRLIPHFDPGIFRRRMQQEHVHMRCGDRAESNLVVLAHEEIAAVDSGRTLGNETIDDLAGELGLGRLR